LGAVEAKPAPTIPTIPSSLPPSGPAGGELTGAYPSPTIGTVSGLDLASSDSATGGINFGSTVSLHRESFTAPGLVSTGELTVQGELRLGGGTFLNLALVSAAPAAGDCNSLPEDGRVVYNTTDNKLYICSVGVWRSIQAS
jgi:hypothetical protein